MVPETVTGSKTDLRYLIDSYLDWAVREPIPAVEGLGVDLDRIEPAPWPRLGGGCRAAFVHLRGRGDFLGVQLIEIPPAAQTDWLQHLYDEVFYVLSGQGSTSVALGGNPQNCLGAARPLRTAAQCAVSIGERRQCARPAHLRQ